MTQTILDSCHYHFLDICRHLGQLLIICFIYDNLIAFQDNFETTITTANKLMGFDQTGGINLVLMSCVSPPCVSAALKHNSCTKSDLQCKVLLYKVFLLNHRQKMNSLPQLINLVQTFFMNFILFVQIYPIRKTNIQNFQCLLTKSNFESKEKSKSMQTNFPPPQDEVYQKLGLLQVTANM